MLSQHQLFHDGAQATIFFQGAHVARFQTKSGLEILFLSEASHFEPAKPIRGGVPLIFPWFGPRKGDSASPAHGFARTTEWQVEDKSENSMALKLESSETTLTLWPHPFRLVYRVEIAAETLRLTLEIHNSGDAAFEFETAFHTYFRVSDVRNIVVDGLEGKTYLDKTQNGARLTQNGPIQIAGETDRVYLDSGGPIVLHDGTRAVRISDLGGVRSSVVWNPWIEKARSLADLGDEEWPEFVCIESGVIADDAMTLGVGQKYEISVEIGSESATKVQS